MIIFVSILLTLSCAGLLLRNHTLNEELAAERDFAHNRNQTAHQLQDEAEAWRQRCELLTQQLSISDEEYCKQVSLNSQLGVANRCLHGYADSGRVCPTCHPPAKDTDLDELRSRNQQLAGLYQESIKQVES